MSVYTTFKQTGKKELQTKLNKPNIHMVPQIDKVIVAIGVWSLATRKGVKDFSELENTIKTITWQHPQLILSKKSISNFKLREGMPSMLRVTLRREKAYDFITRLVTYVFPRVRDFSWLSPRKFDGRGNYSIWFPSQLIFPELSQEVAVTPIWIQVTIATTASHDADAKILLESLWVIFQKPQS
jgi:large subunit ribosomal protein L5